MSNLRYPFIKKRKGVSKRKSLIFFSILLNLLFNYVVLVSKVSSQVPSFEQKPDSQPELTNKRELNLTLSDVIVLALQNNINLKNAYLQRIIDRNDLAVAKDKFKPNITPEVSVNYNLNQFGSTSTNTSNLALGGNVTLKIPTGADIQAQLQGEGRAQDNSGFNQNVTLSFNQPLLRGGGVNLNRISIDLAQQQERANILFLKSTINQTITDVILAYLNLFRTQEQLKITQLSLERAKRQLEITKAFIEAGRQARIDLVESETAVANRQVDLLEAQNLLDEARLALIQTLNIDRNLAIVAQEIPPSLLESQNVSIDRQLELAFANNPDYLRSLISLEQANLNLVLAKDSRKWQLNFSINYDLNNDDSQDNQTDLRTGLNLQREFGNLEIEQAVERSQVNITRQENLVKQQQDNLEIQVVNALRNINDNLRKLEQAQKARELSAQQLENEREKLKLGVRGSRLIDVLNFEDDLVEAENTELNARIDYLTALVNLDLTVGNTLDRWGVKISDE